MDQVQSITNPIREKGKHLTFENRVVLVSFRRNAEQDMDRFLGYAVATEIDIHCITKDDGISLGDWSFMKLFNLIRHISCNRGYGSWRVAMATHLLDKLCDLTRRNTALVQLNDCSLQRIDTLFSRRQ